MGPTLSPATRRRGALSGEVRSSYATALNEWAFARSHGCRQRGLPEPAISSPSASEGYMSAKVATWLGEMRREMWIGLNSLG